LTTKFDSYPGLEQFSVDVDNYSVVDGKYSYFDLPFTPSLFPLGADLRTLPLLISNDSESSIRTEIELPPGFRHTDIEPKTETLNAPAGAGRASISSTNEPGKCIVTYQFDTSPAVVSPKDYPAFLHLESALARKSARLFLLER
jgi:hypothetical protein